MTPRELLQQEELRQLQERVDELEEANRQLKAQLADLTWEPPLELGLTGQEALLVAAMLKSKGVATKEHLMTALYSLRPDDMPDPKIIDVYVCKTRKKLRAYGLDISTVWGRGYELPAATKTTLLGWEAARVQAG